MDTNSLKTAVEGLHACRATFEMEQDVESYSGTELAWKGPVSVFQIEGNPNASICYAWSEPIKGSDKRRFFAVLKTPPVDSPEAAVRASIVADFKASKPK